MTTTSNRGTHFMKLHEWIPIDKLDWEKLSGNPNAIQLLEKNVDKMTTECWTALSKNPNAIQLFEKNMDKMTTECWIGLSGNPNVIHILEKRLNTVDWYGLSGNPNAIHILEKNVDTVHWWHLSQNPNIFTYDYTAMKEIMFNNGGIKEDLMQNRFAPTNLHKFKGRGFDDDEDDEIEYDTYEEWLKQ